MCLNDNNIRYTHMCFLSLDENKDVSGYTNILYIADKNASYVREKYTFL